MRLLRVFGFILLFLWASRAHAADVYFASASAGSANGTSCANAYAWNDGTNGISTVGKWVAGNILHVCGTITCTNNSTGFATSQAAGTNGNPITIKFESGSILTCPAWTTAGAIVLNHQYVVVDGGGNAVGSGMLGAGAGTGGGTIRNTLNGTTGNTNCLGGTCNVQQTSVIVSINAANDTVKNLTITNVYMHTPNASPDDDVGFNTAGIASTNGQWTNTLITHNSVDSVELGLTFTGNSVEVSWNLLTNCNRCIGGNSTGVGNTTNNVLSHNDIGDMGVWASTNNSYHHDRIFLSHNNCTVWGPIYVFDNYFHGDSGAANLTTGGVEANNSADASCVSSNYLVYVWNNIEYSNGENNGPFAASSKNGIIINNTAYMSAGNLNNGSVCITFNLNPVATDPKTQPFAIKNNLCRMLGGANAQYQTIPYPNLTTIDYNIYAGASTSNSFSAQGGNINSFTNWKTLNCSGNTGQCGFDAHGSNPNHNDDSGSATALNLNLSSFAPQVGSLAISTGANLTSLCATLTPPNGDKSACYDFYGVLRPASGAWDVGAVQHTVVAPTVVMFAKKGH